MGRVLNSAVATSEAVIPFSYTIEWIMLENHAGRSIDISPIVTDFKITESIYRQYLSLSMNVKDSVNLLEQFQMTGQEKLTIALSRTDFGSNTKKRIEKTFYVTEYPVYGKMSNKLQVFSVKAISEHAFLSRFKRINRAVDGNVMDIIATILKEDLKIDAKNIKLSSQSSRNISCIIPNMTPLDAIGWLLRRTFDGHGAPFYCFEQLDGIIYIYSQTDLVGKDNKPIRDYIDGKFWSAEQQTTKDYDQRLSRIISIASDLRLSKFLSGARGAFGSTTKIVNLAEKTYDEEVFDYTKEFDSMSVVDTSGKTVISDKFVIGTEAKSLNKYASARINTVGINSLMQDSYNSSVLHGALAKAQSYVENFDTFVHDLSVAGDLDMHAGDAINLKLVKPIDPNVTVKNDKTNGDAVFDSFMSGKHIITTIAHNFDESYSCELRVKRDSLNQDFVS